MEKAKRGEGTNVGPGWFGRWLLVNGIAVAGTTMVNFLLVSGSSMVLAGAWGFVSAAAVYGAQAYALPTPLAADWRRWLAFSIGGVLVLNAINVPIIRFAFETYGATQVALTLAVTSIITTLVTIGVAQWWILRDYVPRAWRWFVVLGGGLLVLGMVRSLAIMWVQRMLGVSSVLVAIGVVEAAISVVATGIGLWWLLGDLPREKAKVGAAREF